MRLTDINTVKELLLKHGFSFSKSLGQNFLVNPSVCPRIAAHGIDSVKKINPNLKICALEIGSGAGVLTRELALTCEKVVAVEIDKTLKPVLDETLSECENASVIFADVLKTDLHDLIKTNFPSDCGIICCANLPYYITTPVIMKLLEEKLPLISITVMVQKEAAERICAPPGVRECGAISAAVRYYSEPKKLFNVSKGSFLPAPKVDSAVIRLNIHENTPAEILDESLYFNIIKAAFSRRRKQAVNPLSETFDIDKEKIRNIFTNNGINPAARAEELTMENLIHIYKAFEKIIIK